HGSQNGKNGFKLSLRGEDPDMDYRALTRDMHGRRTDPLRPAESLILQKATANLPHEGGRRFGKDSLEYAILYRWIAAGCPSEPAAAASVQALVVAPAEQVVVEPAGCVRLRVRALFSDGQERDVSRLAVYEPSAPIVRVSSDGLVEKLATGETS